MIDRLNLNCDEHEYRSIIYCRLIQLSFFQPLRLVLGLLFFSDPVACAFTVSAALSIGALTSRFPAGVSLCSVVLLLAGAFQ